MPEIQHWDVYVCECTHHRSGLWNVAPKDMLCPHCNTEVRPLRVVSLPSVVKELRATKHRPLITAALHIERELGEVSPDVR